MATWTLDPVHTAATFAARHMMISTVRGTFKNITGTLEYDPENPQNASVEAVINVNSMSSTGNTDRDNHLLSPDFLDAAKYPTMTFKSTTVEITGENRAKMTGDLTIRGVTRPIVVDVELMGQTVSPYGKEVVGFVGSTTINREEWGLTWNMMLETGGMMVSKDVKIELDVEAVLVAEAQPV